MFELYGNTPYIDFHVNKETVDYTARIIQEGDGRLRIIPNNSTDSASMLRLGTATIGSVNRPIYLNGGVITACNNGTVVGQWSCQGARTSNSSIKFNWIPTTTRPSSIKIVFTNPSNTSYIASIGRNGSTIAARNNKTWLMTYDASTLQKLYIANDAVTCNMIAIAY